MAHVGAPVVGDERYGNQELDNKLLATHKKRLYLHAFRLSFMHPVKRKKLTLEAPVPQEFKELL
jgi:23S rRNA pseudouridine955/2504/2580 synthase